MNRKYKSAVYSIQSAIYVLAFIFCNLQFLISDAQEIVTPLTCNPVLVRKYNELFTAKKFHLHTAASDTLALPFLDDFSKDGIYPDSALWLDKDAFINRDYPIAPPTLGVATLDGVGPSGKPYDITVSPGSSSPADTLTSKPIHLQYLPGDSVRLSFFWQAQGRGNFPDKSDSLLLQFKINDTTWTTVWFHTGFNTTISDSAFHLVMIQIKDTAFLKNGFQFRFRNWATISGNVDHWHIDYVFLDKNRPASDTIFDDVAFAYNSFSLLKNYTAMPWEQYQPSEMKTNLNFFIRNDDTATKIIASYKYNIYDNVGTTVASYDGGAANILPYVPNGFAYIPSMTLPCIGTNTPVPSPCTPYSFPTLTDTASFLLECALNTTPDKDNWNDTLRYRQKFYDYYAYDDGTVEGGYGLNVLGGEIAYKFTLNNPDTLVAVQMLFNWMSNNVSTERFRITLWGDAGGIPGSVIYQDSLVTPEYNYITHPDWGNLTNDFHTYKLSSPKKLSGTFYVGWQQFTAETLNVGFDKNINSNNKMFYNVGSGWSHSVLAGSWMIRPVFRDTAALASVTDNEELSHPINIFPNPTTGKFTLNINHAEKIQGDIEIYNAFGEKVFYSTIQEINSTIDLSDKPNGIYFLRITDEKGAISSQKFIVAK